MRKLGWFVSLLCAAAVSGCASRAAFNDQLSPRVTMASGTALPLRVAVLPFEDRRGQDNTASMLVYIVLLVPDGWINYDRPEAANGFVFHAAYNFRPSEDLVKAAVEALRQNQFFTEAFFTQREHEPGVAGFGLFGPPHIDEGPQMRPLS